MKSSREKDRRATKEQVRDELKDLSLRDPTKREHLKEYLSLAGPLLADLGAAGYGIETLDDLRYQKQEWTTAVPILLRWLPLIEDPGLKEEIVRCLSVPWVGKDVAELLIHEFRKYAIVLPNPSSPWSGKLFRGYHDEEKKLAPYFSLAWAIGNALSIVDIKGFEKEIIELCKNPKYGAARQMLVLGLGRFDGSDAETAAVDLLRDNQVQIHAINALAKMKSKRALFDLEKLLADKKAAVRKEARKAIAKIMR